MSTNPFPRVPGDFYRVKMTFERTDAHGTVLDSATFGSRLNPEAGEGFTEAVAALAGNTVHAYLPTFVGDAK